MSKTTMFFRLPFPRCSLSTLEAEGAILKIFSMRTIFKVFIGFVTILLLFYVLVSWLQDTWDLSFPPRDWTLIPSIGRQIPKGAVLEAYFQSWEARLTPSSYPSLQKPCFSCVLQWTFLFCGAVSDWLCPSHIEGWWAMAAYLTIATISAILANPYQM